ncbi:MAG TPA: hypothetical protein VFT62_06375 [Mycobacteriales bacterium]|nr:hypothetical protein [Mycobacteriales bacterium]
MNAMDGGHSGDSPQDVLELLVSAASGEEGAVTEVIRPAAIVPEESARSILMELALRDIRTGGLWLAEPTVWQRFDRPGGSGPEPQLVGSLQVAYGTPTRYEITIYRVTVTRLGTERGWTVGSLTDEALGYGGLTLAGCPRARLDVPPKPFRFAG